MAVVRDRSSLWQQLTRPRLVLLACLGAGCGLACLAAPGPVRWTAAALLIGYLPGRAIRVALGLRGQDGVTNVVLDVALSLSCVVFAGLLVNYSGPGIQRSTMLLVLVAVAVIGPLVPLIGDRFETEGSRKLDWRSFLRAALIPTAILVVFAGVALVIGVESAESASNRVRTTALSIASSNSGQVSVTVTNWEHSEASYRLVISQPGSSISTVSLSIRSGGREVIVLPTGGLRGERLQANLYLSGQTSPFREVWVTIPGSGIATGGSKQ